MNCLAGALTGRTSSKLASTSALPGLNALPASSMSSSPGARITADSAPARSTRGQLARSGPCGARTRGARAWDAAEGAADVDDSRVEARAESRVLDRPTRDGSAGLDRHLRSQARVSEAAPLRTPSALQRRTCTRRIISCTVDTSLLTATHFLAAGGGCVNVPGSLRRLRGQHRSVLCAAIN